MELWLVSCHCEESRSASAQGGISRLNRARRIGPLQLFLIIFLATTSVTESEPIRCDAVIGLSSPDPPLTGNLRWENRTVAVVWNLKVR